MLFSIYDYKNRFLTPDKNALTDSTEIYVGTTATEMRYAYMREQPGVVSEGADIGRPYYAEFRISKVTNSANPVKLTVEGARPVLANDLPKFKPDGTPDDTGLAWGEIGTLTIPADETNESVSYRVAFSDSKNKWFRVKATNSEVSAFLMRG
jgi:hypothetical protein